MQRYPHQLSGGMLQRSAIAAALACGPELVIADEPTTALDVLVQIQVIESLLGLVRELGTSLMIITHDLRLLRRTADRIAAMYAGRIVEFGPAERLLDRPRHPYPAALREASLAASEPGQRVATIDGQPPSPARQLRPLFIRTPLSAERTRCAGAKSPPMPGQPRKARLATIRSRVRHDRPSAGADAHGRATPAGAEPSVWACSCSSRWSRSRRHGWLRLIRHSRASLG